MAESNNLYEKELWDSGYKNFEFFKAGDADPVKVFLEINTPQRVGSCFEVGCFPGRYLALYGDKNWEINGIDLTTYLPSLTQWLISNRYRTGKLINSDFENFQSDTKYDLVYSCGFIEHFMNWEEIILKHASLVADNGTMIITTPNFTGIQGWMHRFLDDVNYSKHNPKSMSPKKWARILKQHGFKVVKKGYFGKFDFWYGWQPRPYYKRFVLYRFMAILPFLKKVIFFDSRLLAPFCGIAVKKID
jgi:SAM-dependent methyltransferase